MSAVRTLVLTAGGMVAAALLAAPPAAADPGMPDCGQLAFVCNVIPTMPHLDHDVDMTGRQPPGAELELENLPPADVCALACI